MKPIMRLFEQIVTCALALSMGAAWARASDEVAVVSSKSPITTLRKNQVADIFLGKTARFPDGTPAVAIDQPEGTTVRDGFYMQVTGKSAAQLKAHWSKIIFTGRGQPPKVAANSDEIKKLLVTNLNAIGYIDRNLVDESVKIVLTQ